MLDWSEYVKILVAVLVIVNPLGAVALFISLTGRQEPADRARTAQTTALSVGVVLIVATLFGEALLRFFGISIASFQVGGGILVMLMAVAMMQAKPSRSKQTPEETQEAEDKDSIAVVPLAIPLMAGPGAISTVIIYAHASSHPLHLVIITLACLLVALVTWVALSAATPLVQMLGKTGINIATRLMGLLLAAIAVEFFATGLLQLFPGLRGA